MSVIELPGGECTSREGVVVADHGMPRELLLLLVPLLLLLLVLRLMGLCSADPLWLQADTASASPLLPSSRAFPS